MSAVASHYAIVLKHALRALRTGKPEHARLILEDAQDTLPRDEPLDPMRGVEFPFAENH